MNADELIGAIALETLGALESAENPGRHSYIGANRITAAEKDFDSAQKIFKSNIVDFKLLARQDRPQRVHHW